ncbi:MAG TPA: ABC transporter ATP-binding protein [Anaerolineales bacterium]|nr:ABC transporter ATP-binding protein [Anaerolineales bacterium]
MTKNLAIEAQGVDKRYGHIQALKGVDVAVEEGQIFGLIGANGAGKSTFIKLLVGAVRADAGSLAVLGLQPRKDKRALREQIGYMPQSPALYDDLTAAENLRFFGRAHRLDKLNEKVEQTLDFIQLSERADDPVSTLSGGMKQRVSLACALVHQPRLLLLDEPTAGVDLKLRSTFWERFKQLAADGATILVSTHQMDEAVHCHRLAIISEGSILTTDTPQRLLQRGRATLQLWRGELQDTHAMQDYPGDLPKVLHKYGLDQQVTRLELQTNSLEAIVLDMMGSSSSDSGGTK